MTWDEMTNEERAALVNRIGDARVTYTRGDGVVEIKRHHFDRLRDQIEADGKRIAELEAEVERLTYDGIHSCHDQCQRVACVLERRVDELETALRPILAAADKPVDLQEGVFDLGEMARENVMALGAALLMALPDIRAALGEAK